MRGEAPGFQKIPASRTTILGFPGNVCGFSSAMSAKISTTPVLGIQSTVRVKNVKESCGVSGASGGFIISKEIGKRRLSWQTGLECQRRRKWFFFGLEFNLGGVGMLTFNLVQQYFRVNYIWSSILCGGAKI
jgi:hypothetical protein